MNLIKKREEIENILKDIDLSIQIDLLESICKQKRKLNRKVIMEYVENIRKQLKNKK